MADIRHPLGEIARQKQSRLPYKIPAPSKKGAYPAEGFGLRLVPAPQKGAGPLEVQKIGPSYDEARKTLQNHLLSFKTTPYPEWLKGNLEIMDALGTDHNRTAALKQYIEIYADPKEQMEVLIKEFNSRWQEEH